MHMPPFAIFWVAFHLFLLCKGEEGLLNGARVFEFIYVTSLSGESNSVESGSAEGNSSEQIPSSDLQPVYETLQHM